MSDRGSSACFPGANLVSLRWPLGNSPQLVSGTSFLSDIFSQGPSFCVTRRLISDYRTNFCRHSQLVLISEADGNTERWLNLLDYLFKIRGREKAGPEIQFVLFQ